MTTLSGYLKAEVYAELQECFDKCSIDLTEKHKEELSNHISTACQLCVELALTSHEIQNWLSFCLDYYAQNILSENQALTEKLAQACLTLYEFHAKSLFVKAKDPLFQNAVAEISILLALEKKSQEEDTLWTKGYLDKLKSKNVELVREHVAEFVYHDKIFLRYSPYFKEVDGILSDVGYRKICVLLYALRSGEKTLLRYLVYDLFHENSQGKSDYKIDPHFRPQEILYVKPHFTADILWIVWQGLLSYLQKHKHDHNKNLVSFVQALNLLCQIGYQKKNRKIRLLYLVHAFYMLISPERVHTHYSKSKSQMCEKAIHQMPQLFEAVTAPFQKSSKISKLPTQNSEKRMLKTNVRKEDSGTSSASSLSSYSICSSLSSFSKIQPHEKYEKHENNALNAFCADTQFKHSSQTSKNSKSSKSYQSSKISKKKKKKKSKSKSKSKSKKREDSSEEELPDYLNVVTYKFLRSRH